MKWSFSSVYKAFSRKKMIDSSLDTQLARHLTVFDLTALGVGSTLGVGVYVLAGSVSKMIAGPAVIVSFAIAAVASIFAGLCYAEFGVRVPRAGSAYIYSYVTMGEFMAFLIGWTMILVYMIGSASVVRGLSTYVDRLFDNAMRHAFESILPINNSNFLPYPDFFAFGITLVFSAALAFGGRESSLANNIFTMVNICVVLFVIIAGSIKADINNWKTEPSCTETDCKNGTGGFMPYGVSGVITGAATCFYGFIGFDVIATTGEEAKNPQKSIPIAIITSLTIIFLAYFGVSTVLTTVLPYYEQDADAPFPHMFDEIGWSWAKWLVSVGAVCGLCASLLGGMFPLPRVLYAMASDGLIFGWLGKISPRFQTPLIGTLFTGLIISVMAAIFNLIQLVNMMSIGTLFAYAIVATCILILRYEESETYEKKDDPRTCVTVMKQLVNTNKLRHSTKLTSQIVTSLVFCYIILCICFTALISKCMDEISAGKAVFIVPLVILGVALLITLLFIYLQPVSDKQLAFSVPLVPFLPALSILINIYLMLMMDPQTWQSFAICMAIGLGIYFLYGAWHSNIRQKESPQVDNVKDEVWKNAEYPQVT